MKDQLDYWLSRVTMYRLVTLCLSALLGAAALLSMTGYFVFSIGALAASTAVLLGATYGSGRFFAWFFKVRPHGESSVITALILACLFLPSLEIVNLAVFVLTGVLASASKYLLTVRGRHIFNPAAIATVAVGAVGLTGAAWWVATPALLPVSVVIALLILYKTRRLQMGMVFIAVAILILLGEAAVIGNPLPEAFWFAVASWPLIFFAGVMLSEPLTQPPRRWQQLFVAMLVAILSTVPIRSPLIAMTPAVALVIGNLLAWWWGARRALTLKLIKKVQLTPSSYEFVFSGDIPFVAGQYVELTLPHKGADNRGQRRVFTVAASPGDKTVRFGVKIPERHSTFKEALAHLHPGTVIQATRVAGDFTLPDNIDQPILFVAGGIGITPLISFLRSYKSRDIVLVYAVSSPAEIAYRDILAVAGIPVIIVTAGGKVRDMPGGWEVVEAHAVSADILKKTVNDIEKRIVYVSGPPLMVNAVSRAARKLGVSKIKTDHFAGY